MAIKIKIENGSVISENINGKNGSFVSKRQEGWVDLPGGERRRIRIRVPRDHAGFAPGEYMIGPGSFVVSQYGDLQLGTLELVAVRPAQTAPSPASALR